MTLFTKGFTNDLNQADYKTSCCNWHKKTHLSKKMSNLEPVLPRSETWSLRRLHANFEQKQEKNHVNESLEKTLKHIMLTERTHH